MDEFSGHGLLVADNLRFPLEGLEKFPFEFGIRLEPVSEVCTGGTFVYCKVSIIPPLNDLSDRIVVHSVEAS
jgi:hypothetical protein